ncbi:hypothetical protein L6164_027840 [Bauhinia variegata]|uniref:Uncharacterized protein n=1 Tax=Bauhinia variegata TaxID=167791 RepID=A0ACB9LUB9_BAUVA|nr:hypothetical protein L6164_027840 [Bauhinia variegata]
MDSVLHLETVTLPGLASHATHSRPSLFLLSLPSWSTQAATSSAKFPYIRRSDRILRLRGPPVAASTTLRANSQSPKNGVYTVGEFMTRKEDLYVVKPSTSVDEALEILVEKRITGFPVIDDDWKLVGVVSDYDLLALDSISGHGRQDNDMFPEVDSTWKTFNEVQKLLSKTNGQVIGDLMTPAPMVVRETTNLEDVARLLLETKFRRLPVIDAEGKLVRGFSIL